MNLKITTIALFVLIGVGLSATMPTITFPSGQVTKQVTYTVTWDATGTYYKIQEATDVDFNQNLESNCIATNSKEATKTDGTFFYRVVAYDSSPTCDEGGVGPSTTASITIDTSVTSVGPLSPTSATKSASTKFASAVTDTNGITGCSLLFGSNTYAMTLTGGDNKNGEWSYTFAPAAEGAITAKVNCTDVAGNSKETITAVNVAGPSTDATAPTSVVHISPLSPKVGDSITFTATATDASGVRNVTLYIDNASGCTAATATCSVSKSYSTNGTHEYYAHACDIFNNCADSAKNTLAVTEEGAQQPAAQELLYVEIVAPAANAEYVEDDSITIEATITNQTNNVTDATVTVSGICSMVLTFAEGKYSASCPAALGSTDVIVTVNKGAVTATNTTAIIVECKPKFQISRNGMNVTVAVMCGSAPYEEPLSAAIDGSPLALTKTAAGTYSAELSEGWHNVSVMAAKGGKDYAAETGQMEFKPEASGGSLLSQKYFGFEAWIWLAGAAAAILAGMFFGFRFLGRKSKQGVKQGVQEIYAKEKVMQYKENEAWLMDSDRKKVRLEFLWRTRRLSGEDLQEKAELLEKERKERLSKKASLLQEVPELKEVPEEEIKKLTGVYKEDDRKADRKYLVSWAAELCGDGLSREQITAKFLAYKNEFSGPEFGQIIEDGIKKAATGK